MNKKILITGAYGFIGHNLMKKFKNEIVLGIDNGSTGDKILKGYDYETVDIRIYRDLKRVFRENEIDYIFHLAALPRIERSIADPIETHDVNVTGTLHLLNLAVEYKVKKFIYSSSSSVYGDVKQMPIDESNSLNPNSPYALHKKISEEYIRLFNKVYGLDYIILRYFNVYGAGMSERGSYKLVFSIFKDQLKRDKKLTVYDNGSRTRDFTHVDDVCTANIKSMISSVKNETFNVGTGIETSIKEVALMMTKDESKIEYIRNPRPIDEQRKSANTNKILNKLGWRPSIKLIDRISDIWK